MLTGRILGDPQFGIIEVPDRKYILSPGSQIHLNFRSGGLFGIPQGTTAGANIPRFITDSLSLDETKTYEIWLSTKSVENFEVAFKSNVGKSVVMEGVFSVRLTNHIASDKFPGIYSTYFGLDGRPFLYRHKLETIDTAVSNASEYFGTLNYNSSHFPAVINSRHQLELFDNKFKTWWQVGS